jgi:hypothetical protein
MLVFSLVLGALIGSASSSKRKDYAMAKAATKKAVNLWVVTSDAKIISKQQAAFNQSTGVLKDQAAILAANCVLHMLEHGNATMMTRFARDAVDHGIVRADAIVKWAIGLGMFRAAKETVKNEATGKEEKIDVFKKNDEGFEAALAEYMKDKDKYAKALVSKPFYLVHKTKNPFEGLNFLRIIYAALDQVDRVKEDADKANHEGNDFTGYDEIRAAIIGKFPRPEKKKRKAKADAPMTEGVIVH